MAVTMGIIFLQQSFFGNIRLPTLSGSMQLNGTFHSPLRTHTIIVSYVRRCTLMMLRVLKQPNISMPSENLVRYMTRPFHTLLYEALQIKWGVTITMHVSISKQKKGSWGNGLPSHSLQPSLMAWQKITLCPLPVNEAWDTVRKAYSFHTPAPEYCRNWHNLHDKCVRMHFPLKRALWMTPAVLHLQPGPLIWSLTNSRLAVCKKNPQILKKEQMESGGGGDLSLRFSSSWHLTSTVVMLVWGLRSSHPYTPHPPPSPHIHPPIHL